jgi:hypothetical protein
MAAFLLGALLLFADSAFYLGENWEAIVSDGAFGNPADLSPAALPDRLAANVPDLSQLRYYNGERLFSQGRYREARSSVASTATRRWTGWSLILRSRPSVAGPTGPEPAILQ